MSLQVYFVLAGDPLTLQCTPPQSYPPADVYWVIKERDNRWQAIDFDKRMSMDIEGREVQIQPRFHLIVFVSLCRLTQATYRDYYCRRCRRRRRRRRRPDFLDRSVTLLP